MFRPNNVDQEREEERLFVQNALRKRFQGDQQQMFKDFPAFMEHPSVDALLQRYNALQDAVHEAFLAAGFGAPEPDISLEAADPDLDAVVVEEETLIEEETSKPKIEEIPMEVADSPHEGADDSPQTPQDSSEGDVSVTDPDHQDTTPEAMETPPSDPPALPVKLNLPNGKTGVEYAQKIDLSPLHRSLASLASHESSGFEEIGLTFSVEDGMRIQGCPTTHGKFSVEILLRFTAEEDRPAQDYRLQGEIDILPDPRKMWKELEPDPTLPYQKPHLRSASLHMAGRTMVAASRRGRSHAHTGTFRDDDFELSVNEPQSWYILAVADGAGSAPYSRRGSQLACEKAITILGNKLDDKFSGDLEALAGAWTRNPNDQLRGQIRSRLYEALSHAAYAGYRAICEEAEAMEEVAKAFHTTLLLTIVRQFDFGYFVGTWWVGDGAVGVLQQGKYLKLMGTPDGGQFAGQTRFLTMPEIWTDGATVMKRIEFDVVEDFTAVLLMTDGVSDPKFHTDHNMLQRENWDQLWDDLSEVVTFDHDNLDTPEQLLEWLDFWAAGEHDDRTIAILF